MHAIRRSRRRSPPVPCLPLDEEAPFTNEDERVIARCGTFGYPRLGLPATKIPEDMDVWLSPRSKRKDSRGKGREVGRINPRLCTGTVSQVEGGTAKIRIPFSFFLFFFSLSPLPYFFPLFHSSSPSSPLHFVLEKSPLTTNNLAVEGEGGFLGEESATSVPWPRGKGLCGEVCDDGK